MKNTHRKLMAGLAAFAVAVFFGFTGTNVSWSQSANVFQSYAKPLPIPEFSLEDLSGKTVRIQDCKGKVVLLHFWATW